MAKLSSAKTNLCCYTSATKNVGTVIQQTKKSMAKTQKEKHWCQTQRIQPLTTQTFGIEYEVPRKTFTYCRDIELHHANHYLFIRVNKNVLK